MNLYPLKNRNKEIPMKENNLISQKGYSAQQIYSEIYIPFPAFLIHNEKYKKLSDSSKIAYMLFKDRFKLALQKGWIDNNNMLYLEFTQKKLMSILNCYEGKVKKILDDLENAELIAIVRGKFDPKQKKNLPNKYYILQPDYESNDVYTKNVEFASDYRNAKIAPRKKNAETLDKTGNAEIAPRKKNAETLDNTGNAEIAQYLYNQSFDTNDTNDTQQSQEKLLLEIFVEQADNHVTQGLDKACLQTIATFSDSLAEAEETVGTIIKAKAQAQNKIGERLSFEDFQEPIHQTLKDVYFNLHKKKKQGTLKSSQAFIYTSLFNLFTELGSSIVDSKTSFPQIPMDIY